MGQVYFDNNFFNQRLASLDTAETTRRITYSLQWCFSEELLFELFDSIKSDNNETRTLMVRWAKFCLAMSLKSKIFRNSARIVRDELEKGSAALFESDFDDAGRICSLFDSLSKGNLPAKIGIVWGASEQARAYDEKLRLALEETRKRGAKKLAFRDFASVSFPLSTLPHARKRRTGKRSPRGSFKSF